MKELWRKKSVKAALAVIVILLAVGIVSISVQSSERRKDYNAHVDAAEKYLSELDYEQAIAEYTLALEIEPNSKVILDALEESYLAYAQTYADIEEYESAIEILERGYAQTGRERLQAKIEEFTNLQTQKEEAEKQRLLEEEEAERQRKLEEEAERQRLLAEAQEKAEAEAAVENEKEAAEELPAADQKPEEAAQAAVYQAKAAEYIFNMQKKELEEAGGTTGYGFVDARKIKTSEEFYEYFSTSAGREWGYYVGVVNTSLLEETETQYRIMVSDMYYWAFEMETAFIYYYEIVIDKVTEQGTIVDSYADQVAVMPFEGVDSGTVENHYNDGGYKGSVLDFSK